MKTALMLVQIAGLLVMAAGIKSIYAHTLLFWMMVGGGVSFAVAGALRNHLTLKQVTLNNLLK